MSPGATPGHRVKAAERGGGDGGVGRASERRDEEGVGMGGALAPSRCHTADDTLIPFPPP